MSIIVGYKPYTGAINTNSAQYKSAKAMYDEGHPSWQHGQPFDTSIVRSITREDVENRIVKGRSELALKPRPSLDIQA